MLFIIAQHYKLSSHFCVVFTVLTDDLCHKVNSKVSCLCYEYEQELVNSANMRTNMSFHHGACSLVVVFVV